MKTEEQNKIELNEEKTEKVSGGVTGYCGMTFRSGCTSYNPDDPQCRNCPGGPIHR